MQQVLNEVGQIAQRLAAVICRSCNSSGTGHSASREDVPDAVQQSTCGSKCFFVVVIAALAYFLYKVAKDLLKECSRARRDCRLISALIAMLPQIVYADLSPSVAHGSSQL